MINILDYVLDYNDNFWIVNLIDDYYKGYMIYEVSENGDRYNNITHKKYVKHIQDGYQIIPAFKKIFKPQEFYKKHKKDLTGVWKNYVEVLNRIGIEDKCIGIFGSYLIGFDITKDVDFVIYGKENLNLYYKYNDFIKNEINATYITRDHMLHQYNKHKDKFHKSTDLFEIISRNWSGVQICEGILSTPRFVDLDYQISPSKNGIPKKVIIEVVEGLGSVMLPRVAKVLYNGGYYKLITNVWKYQSFARDGDIIECLAIVDEKNKTLYIADYNCYIKYLRKSSNDFFLFRKIILIVLFYVIIYLVVLLFPKVIFTKMKKDTNIDIIKWAINEDDDSMSVRDFTIGSMPELKNNADIEGCF